MLAAGATKRELEIQSGISKGYLTRILDERRNPGGVGRTNGERLARLFKMAGGYEELLSVARDWWEREGKAQYEIIRSPERHPDPEVAKAIDAVRGFISPTVIAATLERHEGVSGETWDWWITEFAKRERAMVQVPQGAQRAEEHLERAHQKTRRAGRKREGRLVTELGKPRRKREAS
jgi:hypothetical protein